MLLAIDVGNTNTVFALLHEGKLRAEWRIETADGRTSDEYRVWLDALMRLENLDAAQVSDAIIASVVPLALNALEALCRKAFGCTPLIVGAPGVDVGLRIDIPNPDEVGADRLVNAVAGFNRVGGAAIIVDFGTATTFDVIGSDGAYLGGVICPGINLSLKALHMAAAKLPNVAPEPPASGTATGKSTLHAMQSGVFYGYIGLIEGLVKRLQDEHGGGLRVLATGGLAPVFFGHTDAIEEVVGDLTIEGLGLIHARNRGGG